MIKYTFSDGPVTINGGRKANPQVIGEALAEIAAAAGGKLTPPAVVEAARPVGHPLHAHFEWDDSKAAELYRHDQAREIIRVIRVDDEIHDEKPRAFLSVSDTSGVSYRALGEVQGSRDLQLLVLKQAERDLGAFQQRYRDLTDICDLVRPAAEAVKTRRKQAEARAPQ